VRPASPPRSRSAGRPASTRGNALDRARSRRLESATATGTGTSPSSAGSRPADARSDRAHNSTTERSIGPWLRRDHPAQPADTPTLLGRSTLGAGGHAVGGPDSSMPGPRDPVKIIIRHLENALDLVGLWMTFGQTAKRLPTLCGCGRISLPRSSIMSHFTEKPRRTRRRQVVNSRSTIEIKGDVFMARVLVLITLAIAVPSL